jgi:hypothetical protein
MLALGAVLAYFALRVVGNSKDSRYRSQREELRLTGSARGTFPRSSLPGSERRASLRCAVRHVGSASTQSPESPHSFGQETQDTPVATATV